MGKIKKLKRRTENNSINNNNLCYNKKEGLHYL